MYEEQCQRCEAIAPSCGKTMAQIVDTMEDELRDVKKTAATKKDWQEAEESYDRCEEGEVLTFKDDTTVDSRVRCGYRMSLRYGFITQTEF